MDQLPKQREVPVARQQFVDAVRQAEGRHAGIVDDRATNAGTPGKAGEYVCEPFGLAKQVEGW